MAPSNQLEADLIAVYRLNFFEKHEKMLSTFFHFEEYLFFVEMQSPLQRFACIEIIDFIFHFFIVYFYIHYYNFARDMKIKSRMKFT